MQTTAILDGSLSSTCIIFIPLSPPSFFIWVFLIFFLFSIVLSTSFSHFFLHMFLLFHFFNPFLSFPLTPFCHFLPTSPLSFSSSIWACPAVLLMLAVEHPNTCNFDSVNMLGLGRLPQTPDIWCYLSGGAPESVSAVDAGRLPDEVRRHVMQLALNQWCQKMLFWIGSWPY